MSIRAGQLNRRVLIQSRAAARDGAGQEIETWSDVATVWCKVTPMSGGEGFGNSQRTAKATSAFEIRYRTGLNPKGTRVVYDGETYNIESIDELGLREGLVLTGHTFEKASGP